MPTKEKKPKQPKSPPPVSKPRAPRKTAMVQPAAAKPQPDFVVVSNASGAPYKSADLAEIMKQLKIDRAVTVIYVAGDRWTIHLEGEDKNREVSFAKGVAKLI